MPIREQQTTNKQHAIPQSIMSVEFKIIGDLTLKQFIFLLIFSGLAYASFMLVSAFIIKWILVLFFVSTGLAFAFLPLGDRGLDTWIVNFLRAMFMPNQYVYRKDEDVPSVFLYQNLDVLKSELITLTPTSSRRRIEAYLEQQQAPEDKLDIDEKTYVLKVKEAYSQPGYWPAQESAGASGSGGPIASVTATVAEDVNPLDLGQKETTAFQVHPSDIHVQAPQVNQPQLSTLQTTQAQISIDQTLQAVQTQQPTTPSIKMEIPPTPLTQNDQQEKAAPTQPTHTAEVGQVNQSPPVNQGLQTDATTQIIRSRMASAGYKQRHQKSQDDGFYSPAITPDMHSGRRFINLAEEAGQGEIVLPIRGERVLKTAQEQEFEDAEKRKIKELDDLINAIKSKELMQKQIIEAQKAQKRQEEARRAEEEILRVKRVEQEREKQTSDREDQRQKAEQRVRDEKSREESARKQRELEEKRRKEEEKAQAIAREQARLAELRQKEEALRKQKEELLKRQREEAERRKEKMETQTQISKTPKPQPIPIKVAEVNETPTVPNVIWGWVATNYQGTKVGVPGVVVVIRNQKGEVVRAIKTNPQGRFGISTPLINGTYTIEVDKEKRSGLTFDLMQVEAKGQIIPTVEIEGKS